MRPTRWSMRKGGSRVYNNNHLDDQTHAALFTVVTVHRYHSLKANFWPAVVKRQVIHPEQFIIRHGQAGGDDRHQQLHSSLIPESK